MMKPVFTWMTLVVNYPLILALPTITCPLMFDRSYGTNFFDFLEGGSHLWQHLFWIFGHPEVYI